MMNMDKVICIGYFVAGYKKNNDVFLHWQHREKCPEAGPLRGGGVSRNGAPGPMSLGCPKPNEGKNEGVP
jgi:hypothetical protein